MRRVFVPSIRMFNVVKINSRSGGMVSYRVLAYLT
jgi:hypothetical protein